MNKFLCTILLVVTLSSISSASVINIAMHNGGVTVAGFDAEVDGTVVSAGSNGSDVWNNIQNSGGVGPTFSDVPLALFNGTASGATIAANSGYTGYNNNGWGGSGDDYVMMEGWYGFNNSESLTVTGLSSTFTSEGYSVVIYGDANTSSRTMNYTIGGTTKTILDSGTFGGTFSEGGNVVTFSGLAGSSFTITGNTAATPGRSAINGIRILSNNHVLPPVIESFEADDYYVAPGTPVGLNWSVSNAMHIAIDQGIGDVTAFSPDGNGATGIVVSVTTSYTLTATNEGGTATAKLRVGSGSARPNIVLFLVDDMGPHDTSVPFNLDTNGVPVAYNFNSYFQTPNMESLAADGIRFTEAYAQSVCSPTRCGIMTGRNSARHAVTDWAGANDGGSPPAWRINGLDSSDVTLPSLLAEQGYRSIHVGKAHFGRSGTFGANPLNIGFDVNIGGSHWGHPWNGYIGLNSFQGLPGLSGYDGATFLTKALSIEARREVEDAVADGTPFFLHMAFYAVHAPFTTNPDATGDYSAATSSNHEKFATMIEGMDIAVGEIRQKLVDLGVAENTLIVFVGDNGSDSPATNQDTLPDGIYSDFPMRGMKGSKWEGGIRVPMIACWGAVNPANPFQQAIPIPANSIETDMVTTWDLPVTFLKLAGGTGAAGFGEDGYDLASYFSGMPGIHRPQRVMIHYPHDHRSDFFTLLREGDLKLIYNYQNNSHQLYNIAEDPTESNNLAASDPVTLMRLTRLLAQELDMTWGPSGVLKPTIATSAPAGNVVSIPNDALVDVDDDGISDVIEDPDLNGLVDAGELDPDNDNTDGDGTIDGAEVRTGTDPLDPNSDFIGEWIADGAGGFTATWPSAPGAVYEIQTTGDLTDWSAPPVVTGIPASDPGTTTSYVIPASGDFLRFYRVGLLP